ncbi:MerC domain-containing protein [Fodinibius sediminis]|uniref:MerC domain-containing protein n=1 Tax=Fodinibius sediminis TaxID=1214077 RepID=UPI00115B286A
MATKKIWDAIGLGFSGLCIIHCMLIPVVFTMVSLHSTAGVIHDGMHPVLLLIIIPSVYLAIRQRKNGNFIYTILIAGLSILILSWVLHDLLGTAGEAVVASVGSLLLILGHWLNFRTHTRQCRILR